MTSANTELLQLHSVVAADALLEIVTLGLNCSCTVVR
jgi:hypothetical protein